MGPVYQEKPFRVKPNLGNKVKKPIHTADTLLLQQWAEEQKLTDSSGSFLRDGKASTMHVITYCHVFRR